jgi:hypothetical protein
MFDPANQNTFDEIDIFGSQYLQESEELRTLYRMFFDGFKDLALHCNRKTSAQAIEKMKFTGKIPFMKSGDFKKVHNHVKTDAYGIFYLNEIPSGTGGQLVLHDPVFHNQVYYSAPQEYPIIHKKNRLIIGPSYIWHEVSLYLGKSERKVISADCNLFWI